jgi:2-amino-4-hydroxy-6-hydroxymethyldihydropteridine diphosphokinase
MILVAIGGNLPGPHGEHPLVACRAAAESLRCLPGTRFVALSNWYRSAPVPPSGQPDYVNGVARLVGDVDPSWLLVRLHRIERMAGRVRGERDAARQLDLDLVDLNGAVQAGPDLVLPHPRAHERAFVLRPLADVAPDWVHPTLGLGVAELIAALPSQRIARL